MATDRPWKQVSEATLAWKNGAMIAVHGDLKKADSAERPVSLDGTLRKNQTAVGPLPSVRHTHKKHAHGDAALLRRTLGARAGFSSCYATPHAVHAVPG